jgi:hydrogenase maturation protease
MMRILCCGNPDRGDDAAGILVAEQLNQHGIPATVCGGNPLDLIEAWSGLPDVVVADAVVTGSPVGTVHCWDGREVDFLDSKPVSTHGVGLRDAIALARVLGKLPARLQVWGIEGKQFEPGTLPSTCVRESVDKLVQQFVVST